MAGDLQVVLLILGVAICGVAFVVTHAWSDMRGGPLADFVNRHALFASKMATVLYFGLSVFRAYRSDWSGAFEFLLVAVFVSLTILCAPERAA